MGSRDGSGRGLGRTRFREPRWRGRDTVVAIASGVVILAVTTTIGREPAGLRYEPYPTLGLPYVDLMLLVALGAVLAPVAFVPDERVRV